MDFTFDNMLYPKDGLEKPSGTISNSVKNTYPGLEDLKNGIDDFDNMFVVRYNSQGGYAYGGISSKDQKKKIIAITKRKDGIYIAGIIEYSEDKQKSWALSKEKYEKFKSIEDIIKNINNINEGILNG